MSSRSGDGEDFFPLDEAVARRVISEGVPVVLGRSAGSVLTIKEDDTFLVAGVDGGITEGNVQGLGLYHRDTRFLSVYELQVSGADPILLSSSAARGYLAQVDLTNPDVWEGDRLAVPQQTVNVRRTWILGAGLHERIRVKNYASVPVEVTLDLVLGADFADIFEVRGLRRTTRGTVVQPRLTDRGADLAYLGQDDLFRVTRVTFSEDPQDAELSGGLARFRFRIPLRPQQTRLLGVHIEPRVGEEHPRAGDFDATLHRLRRSYEAWEDACTRIHTDNEVFNVLLERGRRDLRVLRSTTPEGGVVFAGVPWNAAIFGRDAAIAAYAALSLEPGLAADTLRLLARLQGRRDDPWRDEQPGRILHELRRGELASAGAIPHTPYYGSADATPLFLMLAAAYFRWTGDRALIEQLRGNIDAALDWIDTHGDVDGDGFVEYERRSPRGLENQGWKDTGDAIVHPDGTPAEGPIAVAEVQAYTYMAKARMAEIMQILGSDERAEGLRKDARLLRERFNRDFWMPQDGYYALALDGHKARVETVTSNPAHGLYCGIVDADKAASVARRLLQPDMFSGWGVRTMSKGAAAYNPMSYHNGSVWPHDNAVIAAGLKRYGFHDATVQVAGGIFETAMEAEYMRLPELFCGFTRRPPNPPVLYPVACSPQAWSAASVFLLLQAMLGISARGHENLLTVNAPMLPPWLEWVDITGMRVGAGRVSLRFTRERARTSFTVTHREGEVRVVMEE